MTSCRFTRYPQPLAQHQTQHASTMSTSETPTKTNDAQDKVSQEAPTPVLGLPEPGTGEQTNKLDLSSGQDTVSLDHLGPVVVNVDGSLARISNWDQMVEIEKKNTLRVLGKRNKARLEALKKIEDE